MRKAISYAAVLLLLAAGSVPAYAQIANSAIVGRITDPVRNAVVNGDVELRRVETNEPFHAATTGSGDYTASSLPFGTYDLKVSVNGFKTEVRSGLVLAAGQIVRSDFVLEIGSLAQSVEVIAASPMLNTETPTTGVVYGNEVIAVLPNQNRDLIQVLANTAPSVLPKRDQFDLEEGSAALQTGDQHRWKSYPPDLGERNRGISTRPGWGGALASNEFGFATAAKYIRMIV